MSGDEPIRRLLPDVAETTVADQVAALDLVALAHPERPYVITNFALTLDGHATISGRSGAIGSATDTAMLVGLRTRVDAVMIGAGTMRAERYGRVIGDPAKRERREAEGLSPDPLMVVVSASLDLPWDAPLFTEGHGRILIATASGGEP
ncbi:MAG: dihydrofolate reductase family protein, partial [Solirubrobacterales bacterium]